MSIQPIRNMIAAAPQAWAIALLVSFSCLVLSVLLLIDTMQERREFDPLTVATQPHVENVEAVRAGGMPLLAGDWCLGYDDTVFGYRTVYMVPEEGAPIRISATAFVWNPGCETLRNPYTLPTSLPAGKYRMAGTDLVLSPDGRQQTTGWATEPFEVPARAQSQ